MSNLFEPINLGDISLKNRVIMAPLTRCRADDRVPNDLMREYYQQRASAGLIITEAVAISPTAVGYANTPGIWNAEQVAAWKNITQAVHQAGGKIVIQLWHVGRISHPVFLVGQLPVAPSAIKPAGRVSLLRPKTEFVTPRALELAEITSIIEDYKKAAQNALEAGFDGVELHAANGYLPDQFLQSSTNHRLDEYGGSLENRARFLLNVVDQLIEVWGATKVGVHLSPRCDQHDMGDEDPKRTFSYLTQQLNLRKIAFLFIREYLAKDSLLGEMKSYFSGAIIANERLDLLLAQQLLQEGTADAVAFGALSIANPDLVERFEAKAALNALVAETIYAKGALGYTDYPTMEKP